MVLFYSQEVIFYIPNKFVQMSFPHNGTATCWKANQSFVGVKQWEVYDIVGSCSDKEANDVF